MDTRDVSSSRNELDFHSRSLPIVRRIVDQVSLLRWAASFSQRERAISTEPTR